MNGSWKPPRGVQKVIALAIVTAALLLAILDAGAAEPRNYAYLLLQGKVTGRPAGAPVPGVTVRITSREQGVFETVTDERGVFAFEKLPVTRFKLQVVTAQGRVIRTVRKIDDPSRIRLEIRTDRIPGGGQSARVSPEKGRIAVEVPEVPTRWKKFWGEVAIIAGVGLLFAL